MGTYVDVEMFGLPCDTVRRKFRTAVVPNNGINPQYSDDPFLFKQVHKNNTALPSLVEKLLCAVCTHVRLLSAS